MGFHLGRWLKILVFQSPRFIDGVLLLIETDIWASQLKKQYSNKTRHFRGAAQNTLKSKILRNPVVAGALGAECGIDFFHQR